MPDVIDDPKIARSGGILPRVEPGGGAKARPKYETTVIGKRPSQVVPDVRATSPQQRGPDFRGTNDSRPTPVEQGLYSRLIAQRGPSIPPAPKRKAKSAATAGIFRKPIPGWNFTRADYAKLRAAGKDLTIAWDSGWFPAELQQNLLTTLGYLLGPTISPPATEGINAMDLFHGHLCVKKNPATAKEAAAAEAKGEKFNEVLIYAQAKALGGWVRSSKYPLTAKNVSDYRNAVEQVLPSFVSVLDEGLKVPGAAVMYHTFEGINPSDLKAKGKKLKDSDPRRHYVTPLDTNSPRRYSPPPSGNYEEEYTVIAPFSFLVDDKGAVHVRPFAPGVGFTSLELSTVTGTTFPEPFPNERRRN